MVKLNGNLHLRQTGKRMDDRKLDAPLRVSITTPSGDVFRWTEVAIVLQPDGTVVIPLPDMEPVR